MPAATNLVATGVAEHCGTKFVVVDLVCDQPKNIGCDLGGGKRHRGMNSSTDNPQNLLRPDPTLTFTNPLPSVFCRPAESSAMIEITTHQGETSGRLHIELKEGVGVAKPESVFSYINMFSGRFDQATVEALQRSPDVVYIEEDAVVYACAAQSKPTEARWSISGVVVSTRQSERPRL
ncbi:hypothetical protein BD779DRAFT_1680988 [Infundibulicybe gibba]|nr:hypothetical protein BD779DRAFT_1680988 [Infundibulicybe gibba]